jgi:hypothetical protein
VTIICSPRKSATKLNNPVASQHKNVDIHTNPNCSTYVNIHMISFKGLLNFMPVVIILGTARSFPIDCKFTDTALNEFEF